MYFQATLLTDVQSNIFYVGQTVDVVRRFSQHRRVHEDIIGFSFISVVKLELDDTEKTLIFKAESVGIEITNAVHVTNVVGDTDFDLVVSAAEQDAWLNTSSLASDAALMASKIILPQAQQLRFSKHFARFVKHGLSPKALALLKNYLSSCVPVPRRTEYSFWSVSCMPSTNQNSWPRLLCLNAGVMEIFVVGWEKQNPDALWSFITVAEDVLLEHWQSIDELVKTYPFINIVRRAYRDAGQHQVTFHIQGNGLMEKLLADRSICRAAAVLVLRVMRKRATIYSKFHCPQLANLAMSI